MLPGTPKETSQNYFYHQITAHAIKRRPRHKTQSMELLLSTSSLNKTEIIPPHPLSNPPTLPSNHPAATTILCLSIRSLLVPVAVRFCLLFENTKMLWFLRFVPHASHNSSLLLLCFTPLLLPCVCARLTTESVVVTLFFILYCCVHSTCFVRYFPLFFFDFFLSTST